jgi:hypothetical protein
MTYRNKRDQAASSHRSYERNKVKMKERALAYTRVQRIRLAEIVRQAKSKPCMDCGNEYPTWVMDLDHRNPKEKVLAVATAVTWGWSIQRLQSEIAKCDVVCSNCHRDRTHKQRVDGIFRKRATPVDDDSILPLWSEATAFGEEPIFNPSENRSDFEATP